MVGIIYLAKNKINGKCYIGQTIHSLTDRKLSHIHGNNNSKFKQAIKKYGKEKFEWKIIDETDNQDILNALERLHISRYESLTTQWGYNSKIGGSGKKSDYDLSKNYVTINVKIDENLKYNLRLLAIAKHCTMRNLIEEYITKGYSQEKHLVEHLLNDIK